MSKYLWVFKGDEITFEQHDEEPESDELQGVVDEGGALLKFENGQFLIAEIDFEEEPENVNDPDTEMVSTYFIDRWILVAG